jgi:hypothetical protein
MYEFKIEVVGKIEEIADVVGVSILIDHSDRSQYPKVKHTVVLKESRIKITFFEFKEEKKPITSSYTIVLNGEQLRKE